jgi:hypothetical protein
MARGSAQGFGVLERAIWCKTVPEVNIHLCFVAEFVVLERSFKNIVFLARSFKDHGKPWLGVSLKVRARSFKDHGKPWLGVPLKGFGVLERAIWCKTVPEVNIHLCFVAEFVVIERSFKNIVFLAPSFKDHGKPWLEVPRVLERAIWCKTVPEVKTHLGFKP